jgi:ribonucleoside-triphosphate reductase
MNEAGLNAKWLRADMTHKETQEFTKEVLNHMRERLSDYQEMYGDLYNLEATPAESTSFRLAKHDRKHYPDIVCASDADTPYYTNSSHLPVGYTEDIFTALDIQDELQTLYTSGTVFHAFIGEKLPDWRAAAAIIRKITENYRLPYYTLSPTYSVCKEHGYIAGEKYTCPTCGKETEVYSRITGYYRPVKNWNDGKAQEYRERKTYDIANSVLTHNGPRAEEECCACEKQVALSDGLYLFASATCPNCKIAETLLGKAGIAYTKMLAQENVALTESLGIKQAPTLVEVKGGQVEKFVMVPAIKKYIQSAQA